MSPRDTADIVLALGRGHPVRVADCYAAGLTRSQLRSATRSGALSVVGRGVVAPGGDADVIDPITSHLQRARALVQRRGPGHALSHTTAGLTVGMPMPAPTPTHDRPQRVTLTTLGDVHDEDDEHVIYRAHHPRLPVVMIDGVPVTSLIRTALDVARGHRVPHALIPIEWALRRRTIDEARRLGATGPDDVVVENRRAQEIARAELLREASFFACRTGVERLRHLARIASPLSESPMESRSRGEFLEAGIHILGQQVRVTDADGVVRRLDFLLAENLAGEVDGVMKYDGPNGHRRLLEEKERDRALRAKGLDTVRWTGQALVHDPATVIRQVRAALAAPRIWRPKGR